MNIVDEFLKNRKCPYCLGEPHDTYAEGFECCKMQFEIANRLWAMEKTKEILKEDFPDYVK